MTKTFSILEFIAEIPMIQRDLEATGPKIVKKACEIVQARAKKTIGTNQPSWAPLAESTIKNKASHGYATPKPLLRTGQLRNSIEYTASGNHGEVGSDDPVAAWQELGTSRIPARSFLASAAISSEDKIHRLAAAATIGAFAGHGRGASEVREILHLLHKAGHALKELGEDLLDDEEDEGKHK